MITFLCVNVPSLQQASQSPWVTFFNLSGIASAIGVFVAIITFRRSTKASIAHTKASIILQCLQRYLEIYEYRTKAVIEGQEEVAKQYWRALVDLLWSEFHLWRNKYIEDETMEIWCSVRRTEFQANSSITVNGKAISYPVVWHDLLKDNYFPEGDTFREFLNEIHGETEASKKKTIRQIFKEYKPIKKKK